MDESELGESSDSDEVFAAGDSSVELDVALGDWPFAVALSSESAFPPSPVVVPLQAPSNSPQITA